MAKKQKAVQEVTQVTLEKTPLNALKQKVEQFRQDDIKGNNSIFFNMQKMREIIEQQSQKDSLPYQKECFKKLLKKSGEIKGMVSTWYNMDDVRILLGTIEN